MIYHLIDYLLIFIHNDPEIRDKQLGSNEGFAWIVEVPLPAKFIIDIEFLDLKTACPNVRTCILTLLVAPWY